MKKILDLATPIINTYPTYANPLSVLQLDYKRTGLWLLNNLMIMRAICCNNESGTSIHAKLDSGQMFGVGSFLWEGSYISCDSTSREHLIDYDLNVIALIKKYILRGYYCYVYVRKFDISAYKCKNQQSTHDIFIYGFDDNENLLYAVDYFGQNYGNAQVPYGEFESAYINYMKQPNDVFSELLFMSPNLTKYKLDQICFIENRFSRKKYIAITIQHLQEHLCLLRNFSYMLNEFDYGINVYTTFIHFLQDSDCNIDYSTVADFSFLADHKRVMIELCEFYELPDSITKKWIDLYEKTVSLKYQYIKLLFSNRTSLKDKIIFNLYCIKEQDRYASEEMLSLLQTANNY